VKWPITLCGILAVLLLGVFVLLNMGCGTWQEAAGKTLKGVSEVGKEASAKAEPGYRAKCAAVVRDVCKVDPCPELEECQHERDRVNSAIKALHRAVQAMTVAIPLIGDVSKAAGGK
jgi:hypothetical protein